MESKYSELYNLTLISCFYTMAVTRSLIFENKKALSGEGGLCEDTSQHIIEANNFQPF